MLKKSLYIIISALALYPAAASALTMDEIQAYQQGFTATAPLPTQGSGQVLGTQDNALSAHSVVVLNQITGEVLYTQRADEAWEPASLTKLLTALVILDTAPNFNRVCTVDKVDQAGGARLAAVDGGAYYLKDLFSAMLVASANNAAKALANRCTGMSTETFVKKMNDKAKSLGAVHSTFTDPSGLDETNRTTAADMAKIANAAFSTQLIRDYIQQRTVSFSSLNRPVRTHHLTSTSKELWVDPNFTLIAGKTGYLNAYNYAASTKNDKGQYLITIVLGNPSQQASFDNTKMIASLGFKQLATTLAAATTR